MSANTPFKPKRGANNKVTATTTSQTITVGAGERSVRIINAGTIVGYFVCYKASDGARVATSADTPIAVAGAAGSVLVIEKSLDDDTIAFIADSTTTIMHFQVGEGGA
jgi:hypothetical protein